MSASSSSCTFTPSKKGEVDLMSAPKRKRKASAATAHGRNGAVLPHTISAEELRQEIVSRDALVNAVEERLRCQHEQLRAAQADLEESRARYVELFDWAPVGYVTLNEAGVVREANLAAATLLGTQRARLKGYPFRIFVAPDNRRRFFEH